MAQFPEAVFGYRRKSDGMVDSICVKCFRTVGTAQGVLALYASEVLHRCTNEDLRVAEQRPPRDGRWRTPLG